ncbi:MAG: tRNA lysidine(34) synthetase TilS [Flavobacteriaceae bacterium]
MIKDKILVAVSGGLDSMVLTNLCLKLGFKISIAHCNFCLRDSESDLDEKFVRDFAESNSVPFFSKSFQTKLHSKRYGLSIQMAARELRYEWFSYLQLKHDFDWVFTAHHTDDNIETFIINLSRGCNIHSLSGIPEKNDGIIRPLLIFNRGDLLNYAIDSKLKWREDSSNSSLDYQRNRVRHSIIPVLKEVFPNFNKNFNKTKKYISSSLDLINNHITNIEKDIIIFSSKYEKHFDVSKIKSLVSVKSYLYPLFFKYGFTDWNEIYNLLEAQSGKEIHSKTHRIIKDRKVLILVSNQILLPKEQIISSLEKPIYIDHMNCLLKINKSSRISNNSDDNVIYIDDTQLEYPLILRPWKNGDYFFPKGFNKRKKLSKFFKDEKLSVVDKSKLMLLCSKDKIVWILGIRQDSRFIATSKSKSISKISIKYATD